MAVQLQAPTSIRLSEMIDQAIGTPEVGLVDFNMLQLILHVIVQQLHIGEKPVELRGSISQLPINREHAHTVNVKEYEVEQGPQGEIKSYKDVEDSTRPGTPTDNKVLVAERIRVGAPGTEGGGADGVAGPESAEGLSGAPIVPPAIGEFAKFLPIAPEVGFKDMSTGDIDAIVMNVTDLRTDLNNLYTIFYRTMNDIGIEPALGDSDPSGALAEHMVDSAENLQRAATLAAVDTPPGQPVIIPGRAKIRRNAFDFGVGGVSGDDGDIKDLIEKLFLLKKRMDKCECIMEVRHERVQDMVSTLEEQVNGVMGQKGQAAATGAVTVPRPDAMKDIQNLSQLYEIVNAMQKQLKELHDIALVHLAAEKEDRKNIIRGLHEQVEVLKVIKLDCEDLAEAMADKADIQMVARKVSRDQFEMACDDLAKGLEKAIAKLNFQESLWLQALNDIQLEIELKLNKMELTPVKEFFTNKLKDLQDNLKRLADLHREVEAAGTKKKLMRGLSCITCDANALMKMEAVAAIPGSKPLTALNSKKPYLTFELDSVRKAQAANIVQPPKDLEQANKRGQQPVPPLRKVRSDTSTSKHVCNRYCGGSHTVTTPAQRVARHGHFIKQWGVDVVPLPSVLAAGDDGQMYKVVNTEVPSAGPGPGGSADQICTPKKRPSSSKPPPKPIFISAECRCLEQRSKTVD